MAEPRAGRPRSHHQRSPDTVVVDGLAQSTRNSHKVSMDAPRALPIVSTHNTMHGSRWNRLVLPDTFGLCDQGVQMAKTDAP